MAYTLRPFRQSPNFTPGAQTKAFYGRPRSIDFGAGHWWDDPARFPSFDGVVATLMNPNRQASAHAVVGDGVVQELVRAGDTSWATGSANPFTVSIETDPQIIYKWRAGGDKAKANRIFETLAEYIADKGWHNLQWFPHKKWMSTGCNPIEWGEVMTRAKQIWQAKHQPAPAPVAEWKKNLRKITPVTLYIARDGAPLRNLANVSQVIKTFSKGTSMEIYAETKVGNFVYKLTKYAYENNTGQGFDEYELKPADPPMPEWQKNLKDITDVKLTVLPAQGTQVINLNTLQSLTPIAKGTVVDVAKETTVGGKKYYISAYSVEKSMPNGIYAPDLGVPAEPPKQEKPEWLENWRDIADEDMYTRVDAPLVNLLDGSTIKTIPINTKVRIASATDWHDQKYLITEYSTEKKEPRGILLNHLDKQPIQNPTQPIPTLDERVTIIEKLVKAIIDALAKIGIKI